MCHFNNRNSVTRKVVSGIRRTGDQEGDKDAVVEDSEREKERAGER